MTCPRRIICESWSCQWILIMVPSARLYRIELKIASRRGGGSFHFLVPRRYGVRPIRVPTKKIVSPDKCHIIAGRKRSHEYVPLYFIGGWDVWIYWASPLTARGESWPCIIYRGSLREEWKRQPTSNVTSAASSCVCAVQRALDLDDKGHSSSLLLTTSCSSFRRTVRNILRAVTRRRAWSRRD